MKNVFTYARDQGTTTSRSNYLATNSLYSLCFTLLRVHSPGLIKRKQMKSPMITEKISPT